jgi:type II secretory pathway pseudopilin PulG
MKSQRGFSVLEALVATAVLATGVATLAQLALMAMRATERARMQSFATIVAEAKLEEIRGAAAADDAPMPHSPAGSLTVNTAGFCDFVDDHGRPIALIDVGGNPPSNAVYVRRWTVEGLAMNPTLAMIQVQVTRTGFEPVRLVGLVQDQPGLP